MSWRTYKDYERRPSNQGNFTESLLAHWEAHWIDVIASSYVTSYVCYLSMTPGTFRFSRKCVTADRMKRNCLGNLPMVHLASLLLLHKSIHGG